MQQTAYTVPLVLASASPRRLELISWLGIPFEVVPSRADEVADGSGLELVGSIARAKCDEVFARFPDRFVLAADTLVCADGRIFGKPRDRRDAVDMLQALSGRWHEVHTGCCLLGPGRFCDQRGETARVLFSSLSKEMISWYVDTGEPMDKAGAYAIQGVGGMFIVRIDGSPSNVMGLPLCLVRGMLESAGYFSYTAQN